MARCAQCGALGRHRKWQVKHRTHVFCDRSCYALWQSVNRRGERSSGAHKRKTVTCCECDTVFATARCNQVIRCEECRKTRRQRTIVQCAGPGCLQTISLTPSRLKSSERYFCGRACYARWRSETICGRAHPLYRNGYTSRLRTPEQKLRHLLNQRMATGMRASLKRAAVGKNRQSWITLVPYTLEQLKRRLHRTMPVGYTWDDFVAGRLHIDHEIPKIAFWFSSPADHDFQRCWALRNLRLLPGADNRRKWAHVGEPFQPSLL